MKTEVTGKEVVVDINQYVKIMVDIGLLKTTLNSIQAAVGGLAKSLSSIESEVSSVFMNSGGSFVQQEVIDPPSVNSNRVDAPESRAESQLPPISGVIDGDYMNSGVVRNNNDIPGDITVEASEFGTTPIKVGYTNPSSKPENIARAKKMIRSGDEECIIMNDGSMFVVQPKEIFGVLEDSLMRQYRTNSMVLSQINVRMVILRDENGDPFRKGFSNAEPHSMMAGIRGFVSEDHIELAIKLNNKIGKKMGFAVVGDVIEENAKSVQESNESKIPFDQRGVNNKPESDAPPVLTGPLGEIYVDEDDEDDEYEDKNNEQPF